MSTGGRRTDGQVPPPVYHWVSPPPGWRTANQPAAGGRATVALADAGSGAAGVATDDGQLALTLAPGSVAAAPGARSVTVRITPLSGAGLRRLPDALRANGNAYRITMTYEPSGRPVTTLARPGSLTLELPELGRSLYRATGSGWTKVPSTPVPPRQLAVSAELTGPGVYVSGTDLPPPVAPETTATTADDMSTVSIEIAIVVLLAALVAGVFLLVRRRRHTT